MWTEKIAILFENRNFTEIRADYIGSVYGKPKPILGHVPHVCGLDPKRKFYLVDFEPLITADNIGLCNRLTAFFTHASHHKGVVWIMVPTGKSELLKKLFIKWKIGHEGLSLIKEIS